MPANKILDPLTMSESAKAFTLRKVVDYVAADPVRHLPQALDVLDALDRTGVLAPHRRAVRTVIDDPSNNWNRLMRSLWEDIDPDVLKTFLENVLVNASLIGYPKQQAVAAEHDCNVPWAILVDPTSACNLRCTGCWAADYGAKLNLTFAELDDIVCQGKPWAPTSTCSAAGSRSCASATSSCCASATPTASFWRSPTARSSTRSSPTRCCA